MTIRTASEADFDQAVAQGTVLVDFWAAWCGPCRMLAPVLEDIVEELGEALEVVKVNTDDNGLLIGRYGIMSLPTMVLFKDGQEVERIIGYQSKSALLALITPHL